MTICILKLNISQTERLNEKLSDKPHRFYKTYLTIPVVGGHTRIFYYTLFFTKYASQCKITARKTNDSETKKTPSISFLRQRSSSPTNPTTCWNIRNALKPLKYYCKRCAKSADMSRYSIIHCTFSSDHKSPRTRKHSKQCKTKDQRNKARSQVTTWGIFLFARCDNMTNCCIGKCTRPYFTGL